MRRHFQLLVLVLNLAFIARPVDAMLFRSDLVRAHWDTWCFFHEGTFYSYYLITEYGYGEGVGVATSKDGVHWEDRGRVLEQSKDNTHYLGSGAVWKAADFTTSGRFIMNYSEHRKDAAGKQTQNILFAWSTNLLAWTKFPAESTMFQVDTNHYSPHGRWDCIFAYPRAEGGYWGTWSATGREIKGTVGVGFSEDGVKWTALPPPQVEAGAREAGAFFPISGKLHAMFIANPDGGIWSYHADSIQGPFLRAQKNPHLLQRGPTAFARFFPTPQGLLANHYQWTGTKLERTPKSDGRDREITYISPFKRIEVDAEGVLRWKYWEGNEALKGRPMTLTGLTAGATNWASGELDLNTGLVLEADVTVPQPGGSAVPLLFSVGGREFAVRVQPGGVIEMEALGSAAKGWQKLLRANRDLPLAGLVKLRVLLRAAMMEVYLDDHFMECWTMMGGYGEKTVRVNLPAPSLLANLNLWTMSLAAAQTTTRAVAAAPASTTLEFAISNRYLNIPLLKESEAAKKNMKKLTLRVDGKILGAFTAPLATNQGDYHGFIDLAAHQGRKLTVEVNQPRAAFGEITLDEQIKGGENLYRETHRPQFHFTSRRGWLNDPNGMIYYQGQYHLYYQHNPLATYWGNMSWGHAVSKDMIHWEEQPAVLFPDPRTGDVFSGAAFIDGRNQLGKKTGTNDVLVAFYLRTKIGLALAWSNDRGQTFTDYEGNPVLNHEGARIDTPRPFWFEPTKRWVAPTYDFFTATNGQKLRCVGFYSSANLTDWKYESRVEQDKWGDELCGCVDFFQLPVDGDPQNKKWVMIFIDGSYIVGTFDGRVFSTLAGKPATTRDRIESLVVDKNYYATMTFENDPNGRRVQLTWMKGGGYPGMPFSQQLTVPSELTLHSTPAGPQLRMNPIRELDALRTKTHEWTDVTLKAGANPLADLRGDLFELEAEFTPAAGAETVFELRGQKIAYDSASQTLTFNNSPSARGKLELVNGVIRLRVLLDRTSVEVFGNDGRIYLAATMVPRAENRTLSASCARGEVKATRLRVHELKSVWK